MFMCIPAMRSVARRVVGGLGAGGEGAAAATTTLVFFQAPADRPYLIIRSSTLRSATASVSVWIEYEPTSRASALSRLLEWAGRGGGEWSDHLGGKRRGGGSGGFSARRRGDQRVAGG